MEQPRLSAAALTRICPRRPGFDVGEGITLSVDATYITQNDYRSYYGRPEFRRNRRY